VRYRDRHDAGRRLAAELAPLADASPLVLGLPRGGVVVAAEVAASLRAPLDVLVVRKLGVPWHPELAFGAIGEDGARVRNDAVVSRSGADHATLAAVEAREREELERRVATYRAARGAEPVEGRTVIVVDDGLATGATAEAALQVVRARNAARIVLAVPVAPPDTVERLRGTADDVVALETPRDMVAIGLHYDDFTQVTDDEVIAALRAGGQL
jgi:putative phosphoribosyl transferase